jgi:sugar (pentulose or hexulose) kinase
MGVGGLADGVLTVVAGSSTPVQAATDAPVQDPLGRPWVSTHAAKDLWAVEGNAGYPGSLSGWWSSWSAGSDEPGRR